MGIKTVTVGIQRVINLGNYENVRYECSVIAEVEEGKTPEETYQEALGFCKEKILAELDRIKPVGKAK